MHNNVQAEIFNLQIILAISANELGKQKLIPGEILNFSLFIF